MKHRGWLLVLSLMAMLVLALPALGQQMSPIEESLYFHDMWARSTASVEAMQAESTPAAGATDVSGVSAVYMTIANAGGVGVRLLSAESPVAEVVEIHEMQMDGDVMRMRPVEGGIEVAAGNVAVFEPGGFHFMLMNLTEPLVAGQAVPLTLTFAPLDDAGNPTDDTFIVQVAAPVADEQPPWTPFAFSLVWARPADEGGTSGAFMSVFNIGDTADALTAASSDVAALVEIHETSMVNDVMQMRPVESGVPVGVGEITKLEPGAIHIMLMDLTQPLEAGGAFTLTLTFESGETTVIGVPVYDRTMMEMSGM